MSLASDPAAAAKVGACLKDLFKLVGRTEESRASMENTARDVNAMHAKIEQEEKLTGAGRTKLRNLYDQAIRDAEKEEECLRKALDKIYAIRQIRADLRIAAKSSGQKETIRRGALMKMLANSAETIPLWVGRKGEDAPQLCGAVPAESNYVATPGDMAAALVRSSDGDENWILSEVVSYSGSSGRDEVDDIDEAQQERPTLSRRTVSTLPPQRAFPAPKPEAPLQTSTPHVTNSPGRSGDCNLSRMALTSN